MQLSPSKNKGVMQAAKWLSQKVLLDGEEMEDFLAALDPFSIYNVSQVVHPDKALICRGVFLSKYIEYVRALKEGLPLCEKELQPYFSAAFSATTDAFYAMEIKEQKWVLKAQKPVVQLNLHAFTFSKEGPKFHSMIHSKEGITWGLQFAFPQIYSNSMTNDVIEVYKDSTFPNTQLFKKLSYWIRHQTMPARFVSQGKAIYATFRLGKKCRSWIHTHPQLKAVGLFPCS